MQMWPPRRRRFGPQRRRKSIPDPRVRLWALRLLVQPKMVEMMHTEEDVADSWLMKELGIPLESGKKKQKLTEAMVQTALDRAEERTDWPDSTLGTNVASLARAVSLSPFEQEVLLFIAALSTSPLLQSVVRAPPTDCLDALCESIEIALQCPASNRVEETISPKCRLQRSGLLSSDGDTEFTSDLPVCVPSEVLRVLMRPSANPDDLLKPFFRRAPESQCSLEDFPHLHADADILLPYAKQVCRELTAGRNVLIYGKAGTGKTALIRAVAAELGLSLFEVACQDNEDRPVQGRGRLTACALAQQVLATSQNTLLLFDEIEDLFPRTFFFGFALKAESAPTKAFINRLLEENPVPTIWISNEVDHIDPAVLRRFDLVIKVGTPPPGVRRRVLQRHTGDAAVTDEWLDQMSRDERIQPGHVERAARVVTTLGSAEPAQNARIMERVIQGHLQAIGASRIHTVSTEPVCDYDLAFLNTSEDIGRVVAGFERTRRGTACLYGPPGTGKSALANHLAERLGVPLIAARASDIFDKYVGGTERNLARLFDRAAEQNALLLLDEADSFLQPRGAAFRSWEVAQVNELLVQMEAFAGIFICATNLFEGLDEAALRRFNLKVRFDPLEPDQRWEMLIQTLRRNDSKIPRGRPATELRKGLDRLDTLTPGDFAATTRKLLLLGEPVTAQSLLAGVADECGAKPAGRVRRVGFGT